MAGEFVSFSIGEDSVVIRVSFPHDLSAWEQERAAEELIGAAEAAARRVAVVDLSGVETANSRFLGALLSLLQKQRQRDGKVLLVSVRPWVAETLARCALDVLFECYPSAEAALKAHGADSA